MNDKDQRNRGAPAPQTTPPAKPRTTPPATPPPGPSPDLAGSLARLEILLAGLLHPELGCPWDLKQTPKSIAGDILEESHELREALLEEDPEKIREEAGDLTFLMFFLGKLLSRSPFSFGLKEIVDAAVDKMVFRHPHVFESGKKLDTAEEVLADWSASKRKRNRDKNLLESVPAALPALFRAHKLGDKAGRAGFDFKNHAEARAKLAEELGELDLELSKGEEMDPKRVSEEIGDTLSTLASMARLLGLNAEESLRNHNREFQRRVDLMENTAKSLGLAFDEIDPDLLELLWQKAKRTPEIPKDGKGKGTGKKETLTLAPEELALFPPAEKAAGKNAEERGAEGKAPGPESLATGAEAADFARAPGEADAAKTTEAGLPGTPSPNGAPKLSENLSGSFSRAAHVTGSPLKVHMVSLGCPKNMVDSERILPKAMSVLGAEYASDPGEADLVLLNTCAFIREAEEEARENILSLGAATSANGGKLVVLGCLPARRPDLGKTFSNVADAFLPYGGYDLLEGTLEKLFPERRPERENRDASSLDSAGFPVMDIGKTGRGSRLFEDLPRVLSAPDRPWGYLKISDGCSRTCSFCVIPEIRGPLVSRDPEDLVAEAALMARNGALELNLIAQDLLSYRAGGKNIAGLLEKLSETPGLSWMRLMYVHPDTVDGETIREIKGIPKVLPYLDIPFQHASPRVLELMGRKPAHPMKTVEALRNVWPEVSLRGTFMTGFPGETREDFGELCRFLGEAGLNHAAFFEFSPEEGARASLLPDRVPPRSSKRRFEKLLRIQLEQTQKVNSLSIGKVLDVLVEGPSEESNLLFFGRTPAQAPEVDGITWFDGERPEAGKIVKAKIRKARGHDMVATLSRRHPK
ncbi:MAG: 30S ribosomal protein S12 methylthiotransferase RimO [Deltaproteobacteria bacterium]|jgi:ribosomal protein S12 methylthiotransferase|nr:30S ribosomal protein S12 methylthiotransferase RimO [Deltaproteobacteria bacterium]